MKLATFLAVIVPLALLLAPTAQAAADSRQAWQTVASDDEQPLFRARGNGEWSEFQRGRERFIYWETARTGDYIVLTDFSRGYRVRLWSDRAELKLDTASPWGRFHDGGWLGAMRLRQLPALAAHDHKLRLVYFVPADRQPVPDYAAKIQVLMHFVAELYRTDLQAKGYKTEGLMFESDDKGPIVHLVRGTRTAHYYNGWPKYDVGSARVADEVASNGFDFDRQIVLTFAETYDPGPSSFEWPGGVAEGGRHSDDGGSGVFSAWILRDEFCATSVERQTDWFHDSTPIIGRVAMGNGEMDSPRHQFIEDGFGAVAHELAHALGISHDLDARSVMSNGFRALGANFPPSPNVAERVWFIPESARMLMSNRNLNPALDPADHVPPTIHVELPTTLRAGTKRLPLKILAADDRGLRALVVHVTQVEVDYVIGGQELSGTSQALTLNLPIQRAPVGTLEVEVTIADQGGNWTIDTQSLSVEH